MNFSKGKCSIAFKDHLPKYFSIYAFRNLVSSNLQRQVQFYGPMCFTNYKKKKSQIHIILIQIPVVRHAGFSQFPWQFYKGLSVLPDYIYTKSIFLDKDVDLILGSKFMCST